MSELATLCGWFLRRQMQLMFRVIIAHSCHDLRRGSSMATRRLYIQTPFNISVADGATIYMF